MKRLSQIIDTYSLADIVEASKIVDGDVEPKPNNEPEDEMKFVRFHRTEKHDDRVGNKSDVYNATNVKTVDRKKTRYGHGPDEDDHDDSFSPKNEELEEEIFEQLFFEYLEDKYDMEAVMEELDEDQLEELMAYELEEGIYKSLPPSSKKFAGRLKDDRASIARPKFDEKGNVILTKKAASNIDKVPPKSRKIGKSKLDKGYKGTRYEETEQLDETGAVKRENKLKKKSVTQAIAAGWGNDREVLKHAANPSKQTKKWYQGGTKSRPTPQYIKRNIDSQVRQGRTKMREETEQEE